MTATRAPDLIVTGARVLTMWADRPRAGAVAICDGLIVAVGDRAEVEPLAGPDTRVIDAGGATVLPGFVESHLHLVLGGSELTHQSLVGIEGEAALTRAFRAFATANPDAPLLMGQGGDYGLIGRAMTRHDLDRVIADRPIAITAPDHHTVWANTAALRAGGLLHGAATPPGHDVVMGEDGTATGELREFEAFAKVIALGGDERVNLGIATGRDPAPWPDAAALAIDREKAAQGLAHCAAHGITSVINMDGNRYSLALLDGLRAEGRLTARVKVPFHFKPDMGLEMLEEASAMAADYSDGWLSSGMVKLFMDGVMDSRTAFRLDDYPGQPGHRGAGLFGQNDFARIAAEADRRGLQIAVHAIGDAAVRRTLDGYAAARAANGPRDSRHRIEHIELLDRADLPRFAALGVTCSIQPVHGPGVLDFGMDGTEPFGTDRLSDAFLCRDLQAAGAMVCFSSDWPVTDISVLRGIRAQLIRSPYPGASDQRLPLADTLAAYTARGAWAAHMERLTGTIRPGLAGDLVILTGDIEAVPEAEIDRLGIRATIAGGRVTHGG